MSLHFIMALPSFSNILLFSYEDLAHIPLDFFPLGI